MSDRDHNGKGRDRTLASPSPVQAPPSVLDALGEVLSVYTDIRTARELAQRLDACGYGGAAVWVRENPYKCEVGVKHGFTTWGDDR